MAGWQRDTAVVLAAHGDRAGATPNATLLAHRDALTAISNFSAVTAGTLKGDPSLEDALAAAAASGASRILLYPFFMADGYFTGTVVPRRIADAGLAGRIQILPPLGLDPLLAPLIHATAIAAGQSAGMEVSRARLLLVGHGSELGPASANATRAMLARVAALGGFSGFDAAFLEEPPFLDAQLAAGEAPMVVSGFFSGDGLHAGEDVPEALAATSRPAVYAGSIGTSDQIPRLILQSIEAASGR